ncbi:hypothetical protein S40293_04765 [Stachybotrys chartarum IBT 40293]|nr:hypothetical protein S40293_04765 [Stachybotrys chartarum IBT 40293]
MASVQSLGLHQPTGLQHAVEEQILPPDASVDSYTWEYFIDVDHTGGFEDELITTRDSVVWCRGGIFRKTFKFQLENEPIVQALLAYFPTSEDDGNMGTSSGGGKDKQRAVPPLEKALVVILKTQAHIYFLSGTTHVVHLPFEVETAFAGPRGIIIQRKQKTDSTAPLAIKFPRVPPNSFVSSQLTAFNSSQLTNFSVDTLGKPKALPIGPNLTLENMWDAPVENPESHWPRLMSLTDPLLEIGLVVAEQEHEGKRRGPKAQPSRPSFLPPAEEILHIEQVDLPGIAPKLHEQLILAVTINRDTNVYSLWRLTYLAHQDPFLKQQKSTKNKINRRRSSMQPAFASGTSTPLPAVPTNVRDSFGAPLPGKRQRKSERVEKPLDLVSSLEQQDKEGTGATRRSSRRVSSMLARADLSASHERAVFTDQSHTATQSFSRRHESQGSQSARLSTTYNQQIHPSLSSLLEAPFDEGLDRVLHNMGLEDHDFDGFQREVRFTKIHSVSSENSNVRYSSSGQPARSQAKVFILPAPSFATNEYHRSQLLIGVQDSIEKRLQLIYLDVKLQPKFDLAAKSGRREPAMGSTIHITPGEIRVAKSVVDSCKLTDGEQSVILILSEAQDGHHELSTQAPWRELTKISLSLLFVDDTRSLQFRGRMLDRDVKQKKSEVIDMAKGSIVGLRHARQRGVVDVVDTEGRLHQLRIQLRPQNPQVRKILALCQGVLPDSLGERFQAAWSHVMQWLGTQNESLANKEWSALVILLLSSYLNLGRKDSTTTQTARLPVRRRRPASGSFGSISESDDWKALETGETINSSGCPTWMMNRGWQWALDGDLDHAMTTQADHFSAPRFMSQHIALARDFMGSRLGNSALGDAGYLPTALGRSVEARSRAATDLFIALHLLLEEQKLDIMTPEHVSPGRADLRVVMGQIARWLKWHRCFSLYELGIQEELDPRHDSDINLSSPLPEPPVMPSILEWIRACLIGGHDTWYTTLADIYYSACRIPDTDKKQDGRWDAITPRTLIFKHFFRLVHPQSTAVEMVEAMKESGLTAQVQQTLPEAILVLLQDAISLCQPHPPTSWTRDLLELVKRSDIDLIQGTGKHPRPSVSSILTPTHISTLDFRLLCQSVDEVNNVGYDEGEGTERQAVIRALFREDRRLNEAHDLLSTHKTRVVRLDFHPTWSESEWLEKQKEYVSRVATGTLAIPAGRGLLYYSLRFPLITQKFHIGGFNFHCIVRPTNNTVGVDKALFTEEKVCWGFFHQGVAAGLAISPGAKGIDTSWILYNKPSQELSNRHAGFLLALGLNGHLKGVAKWVAFKYLTPKHTMTSIGLLLGLAASYMGTMDSLITRLLSVHATRMLPRGAAELNLSPLTQTSGIMGIGLLYCNSQHRRMSEIMLSEIEHTEDEDEEEPLRSECYRLAAGFALGFINLGKGNDLKGLQDMKLTEKLVAHATATKKVEIVHVLDRAAAGAVMAVALIFMKTEDQIVARKIGVPESVLQFDYVRPDILLLRTIARNLILWSKMEPSFEWIQRSLPAPYRARYKLQAVLKLRSTDLPFFSILSGLCFSIALRFSGSASIQVRDLLLFYLDQFMRIARITSSTSLQPDVSPPYDEELARANARMCQDILAISCSIVMAGTGDIAVLRRLRALHGRDDPNIPYGSHLAAHLAIGALFLGCGTATFGSSDMAIAALLVAFYPVFPTDVMDNRSHLQAFRHFWVLATEQRCLVIKDVSTGQPVSVPVVIKMKQESLAEQTLYKTAPCLLPPLDQIASLSTACAPHYWDLELDFSNEKMRKAFASTLSLHLRKRPPRESAFASTLRSLGKSTKRDDPLDWIFGLDGMRNMSYAEREALLENGDDDQDLGAITDARMELERGILDGGDRERLEGAKLLFEWASVRDRLLAAPPPAADDSQATVTEEYPQGHPSAPSSRNGGSEDRDAVWWMGDGVIEDLKGKVWLATQDGE